MDALKGWHRQNRSCSKSGRTIMLEVTRHPFPAAVLGAALASQAFIFTFSYLFHSLRITVV
jgi:hypothetical protein